MKIWWFLLFSCCSARLMNYSCFTLQDVKRVMDIADEDFFCSEYVNYSVACDANEDPVLKFNPSCNNTFSKLVLQNLNRALIVYRQDVSVIYIKSAV